MVLSIVNLNFSRRFEMNLYLIKRDDPRDEIDWDEFRGHVIAATSEIEARKIASFKDVPRLEYIWLTSERGVADSLFSTVTLLASDVDLPSGIVLSDFNAG